MVIRENKDSLSESAFTTLSGQSSGLTVGTLNVNTGNTSEVEGNSWRDAVK